MFSAMCFESANSMLSDLFSGTRSHCDVICRRYLERVALLDVDIENDAAEYLCKKWTGQLKEKANECFSADVFVNDAVILAQRWYPNALLFSRATVDSIFFDSTCYRRCPSGPNSYFFCKQKNVYGQFHCFLKLPEEMAMGGEICAIFSELIPLSEIIPVECQAEYGFYLQVKEAGKLDMIETTDITKMFCLESRGTRYLLSIPRFIDHK